MVAPNCLPQRLLSVSLSASEIDKSYPGGLPGLDPQALTRPGRQRARKSQVFHLFIPPPLLDPASPGYSASWAPELEGKSRGRVPWLSSSRALELSFGVWGGDPGGAWLGCLRQASRKSENSVLKQNLYLNSFQGNISWLLTFHPSQD